MLSKLLRLGEGRMVKRLKKVADYVNSVSDDVEKLSDDELRALYGGAGLDESKATIAYCRIGERSAHTWFVLHELLGRDDVKNYDGSWTEYGSLVGVPIEKG